MSALKVALGEKVNLKCSGSSYVLLADPSKKEIADFAVCEIKASSGTENTVALTRNGAAADEFCVGE